MIVTTPPIWSEAQLEAAASEAVAAFRQERVTEPLESYQEAFDRYYGLVSDLLEVTVDLSELHAADADLIANPDMQAVLRYLASPPISSDDLKVLSEADSLSRRAFRSDPDLVLQVVSTALLGLDRYRFPWVGENRGPTEAERETAAVSTAVLLAVRRVMTNRANDAKQAQEDAVAARLEAAGFTRVHAGTFSNTRQTPKPGEYCRESNLVGRKADLIAGLWDGRIMPIECKVSNSALNSIKRVNNDAAIKAQTWRSALGPSNVVPAAVLAGVFGVANLQFAQTQGLTLWWAHDLDAMIDFIELTHP